MISRGASSIILACAFAASCGEDALTNFEPRLGLEPNDRDYPAGPLEGDALDELPTHSLVGPPYPIVLAHGFSGWSDIGGLEYFFDVVDDLGARGDLAFAPATPPYAHSLQRAQILEQHVLAVLRETNAAKVHLVGHSQGGVDLREVVQHLPVDRIASITTIATPHHGTPVADVAASAPAGVLNPAGQFLAWLVTGLDGAPPSEGAEDSSDAWTPEMADVIEMLRPASMEAFIADRPWPEGVPVFSIAGVSNLLPLSASECDGGRWERSDRVDEMDALFLIPAGILSYEGEGSLFDPTPNDGLVPVASAKDGVFLGCVAADHIDEIGQVADLIPGLLSGFDHKSMMRKLVDELRTVE
jgi:triacylglycerol lipase